MVQAREVAEAMAAEGIRPDLIRRVLLNLGFSKDEAQRAVARACIITGVEGDRHEEPSSRAHQKEPASRTNVKEPLAASIDVKVVEGLQRRVSVLESRVAALVDLLSEYVPAIVERVRSREPCNGGVQSHL